MRFAYKLNQMRKLRFMQTVTNDAQWDNMISIRQSK